MLLVMLLIFSVLCYCFSCINNLLSCIRKWSD